MLQYIYNFQRIYSSIFMRDEVPQTKNTAPRYFRIMPQQIPGSSHIYLFQNSPTICKRIVVASKRSIPAGEHKKSSGLIISAVRSNANSPFSVRKDKCSIMIDLDVDCIMFYIFTQKYTHSFK